MAETKVKQWAFMLSCDLIHNRDNRCLLWQS